MKTTKQSHKYSEYTTSGDLINRSNAGQTANLWKHSAVLCRRVSIHNALRDALLSPKTTGPVAELHLSSRAVEVIPQSATVLFEDGSSTVADMIIGADGIKESESAFGDSDDKRDHKNRMMEIFRDFDPRILGLLELAEPSSVRLWQLFDMDPPSTRCTGKLGLVGDAALPFLPHIGQGAACALEDAASLSAIFPLGTTPQDVPSRLELYERTRKGRAEEIHAFSRLLGQDLEPGNEDARVNRNLITKKYFPYIFSHDEYENSAYKLQEFLSQRNETDDTDHSGSLKKLQRQES
ncbi:MAG: hypothetical protein Q9214_002321 [Letrouitia sp. 1 TL-2023]